MRLLQQGEVLSPRGERTNAQGEAGCSGGGLTAWGRGDCPGGGVAPLGRRGKPTAVGGGGCLYFLRGQERGFLVSGGVKMLEKPCRGGTGVRSDQ